MAAATVAHGTAQLRLSKRPSRTSSIRLSEVAAALSWGM